MAAQILVNQATRPAGTLGTAREDGVISQLVTCTSGTVASSYTWVLVDVPIRSALVRGATGTAASFTFTPDVKGTYLVSLRLNGSSLTADNATNFIAVLSYGTHTRAWRYPAAREENIDNIERVGLGFPGDINTRGWATNSDLVIEDIEAAVGRTLAATVVSPGPGSDSIVKLNSATGMLDPSVIPSETNTDDFTGLGAAWAKHAENGGEVKGGASATAYGFPSQGVITLSCSDDAGSKTRIQRANTGLVLGAAAPIVVTARYYIPTDDENFIWFTGIASQDGEQSAVVWGGLIDGGARVYRLITVNAGILTATDLGAPPAGTYFTARLTITESGTTVELAPDEGDFVELGTAAVAPDQVIYSPMTQCAKDSGGGNRVVVLDRVSWAAVRTAADSGAITGDEFNELPDVLPMASGDYAPMLTDSGATISAGIADSYWYYQRLGRVVSVWGKLGVSWPGYGGGLVSGTVYATLPIDPGATTVLTGVASAGDSFTGVAYPGPTVSMGGAGGVLLTIECATLDGQDQPVGVSFAYSLT